MSCFTSLFKGIDCLESSGLEVCRRQEPARTQVPVARLAAVSAQHCVYRVLEVYVSLYKPVTFFKDRPCVCP